MKESRIIVGPMETRLNREWEIPCKKQTAAEKLRNLCSRFFMYGNSRVDGSGYARCCTNGYESCYGRF